MTPASVVLVDGRSGAGKSTFAAELVRRWPAKSEPTVVPLDRLYPGWDGLEAGAAYACARILVPRAAGREAVWQEWDWAADAYARRASLAPNEALVIEGSGCLTPAAVPLADIRVWLEAPEEFRRDRALARDGDTYRPHWDRWATQERRHLKQHNPRENATHVFRIA